MRRNVLWHLKDSLKVCKFVNLQGNCRAAQARVVTPYTPGAPRGRELAMSFEILQKNSQDSVSWLQIGLEGVDKNSAVA